MSSALELRRALERWNPLQKRARDGTWGEGAGRLLGDQGVAYMGRNDDGGFNLGLGSPPFRGAGNTDEDDTSGDVFGHTARLSPAAVQELHARLSAATAEGKRRQAAADAEWEEHGTTPDHGDDFVVASGYVSGEDADVHYSVELDDYSVGVETYLAVIPHSSDATLDDFAGAEQAATFDPAETRRLLARLGALASTTESAALDLWRALEARHNLRGPDGRFIKAGGSSDSSSVSSERPTLADVIKGTAALGPKRQRDDRGASPAVAARRAAVLSDTTGRPTQRSPQEHAARGAHDVADEVERVLADTDIPDSLRGEIVARARAIADSHGKRQPKGGTSRLSEQSTQDLKKWLEIYGTERPRSKQVQRELDRRRARQDGPPPPARPPAAQMDADRLAAVEGQLAAASTREEAREHLAGMTAAQLRQLASFTQTAVGSGDTKARLTDRLVDGLVGRRLDSDAIGRMANR